jgi:hypothetical protein
MQKGVADAPERRGRCAELVGTGWNIYNLLLVLKGLVAIGRGCGRVHSSQPSLAKNMLPLPLALQDVWAGLLWKLLPPFHRGAGTVSLFHELGF